MALALRLVSAVHVTFIEQRRGLESRTHGRRKGSRETEEPDPSGQPESRGRAIDSASTEYFEMKKWARLVESDVEALATAAEAVPCSRR